MIFSLAQIQACNNFIASWENEITMTLHSLALVPQRKYSVTLPQRIKK
jgi:hypothetical protein